MAQGEVCRLLSNLFLRRTPDLLLDVHQPAGAGKALSLAGQTFGHQFRLRAVADLSQIVRGEKQED